MKPFVRLLSGLAAALLAAAALPALAQNAQASAKPDLKRGEAIATQVCAACHTVNDTRGIPANPILQGQHPDYLVKQLKDFKAGARASAVMKPFASALSDDDMRNVATFYAAKTPQPGFAKNKDLVAVGEKIHRGGIADRQIPACAACHGPAGSGIPSRYPRLAGQHAEYTEAQLIAFRSGARANSAPMHDVAFKMNDREIKAVSDYLAGLHFAPLSD